MSMLSIEWNQTSEHEQKIHLRRISSDAENDESKILIVIRKIHTQKTVTSLRGKLIDPYHMEAVVEPLNRHFHVVQNKLQRLACVEDAD